jgi:hypothetical protein
MGTTNFDALGLTGNLAVGGDAAVTGDVVVTGSLTAGSVSSLDTAQETFTFFDAGAQTTGTLKNGILVGVACTVVDVRAYIITAPVGAAFIIDVNKNGTTLFTSQAARPTIADGGNASTTTAPAVVALAAGDRLTYDVDQIGSGTAGTGLYVSITVKRAFAAA